ncbi:14257_t:CDS:2, partial [Ambispora leptoticha]
ENNMENNIEYQHENPFTENLDTRLSPLQKPGYSEKEYNLVSLLAKNFVIMSYSMWDSAVKDQIRSFLTQQKLSDYLAFSILEERVAEESPDWACLLAFCYHYGIGTEFDYQKAFAWYMNSGDRGDAFGLTQIGWCYSMAIGVSRDDDESLKYYHMGAIRGHPQSALKVGESKSDFRKRFYWLEKSAIGGFPDSIIRVIRHYENGWGVSRDKHKVLYWFKQYRNIGNHDVSIFLNAIMLRFPFSSIINRF